MCSHSDIFHGSLWFVYRTSWSIRLLLGRLVVKGIHQRLLSGRDGCTQMKYHEPVLPKRQLYLCLHTGKNFPRLAVLQSCCRDVDIVFGRSTPSDLCSIQKNKNKLSKTRHLNGSFIDGWNILSLKVTSIRIKNVPEMILILAMLHYR